jgi:hypothetical protein
LPAPACVRPGTADRACLLGRGHGIWRAWLRTHCQRTSRCSRFAIWALWRAAAPDMVGRIGDSCVLVGRAPTAGAILKALRPWDGTRRAKRARRLVEDMLSVLYIRIGGSLVPARRRRPSPRPSGLEPATRRNSVGRCFPRVLTPNAWARWTHKGGLTIGRNRHCSTCHSDGKDGIG